MTELRPAEVFPVSMFIQDELDYRHWTVENLATLAELPVVVVQQVLLNREPVTPAIAEGLGRALGVSPQLILNLDTDYRKHHEAT